MRYLTCILALFFLPLTGHAQINVDTLQAFLDNDKNCGDFQGVIEATRHHRALQIIVNDDDADPHGLDRDGNGIACESKTVLRRVTPEDTTSFWYQTVERIKTANCPAVSESFDVDDTIEKIRKLPIDIVSDSTEYAKLQSKVTCLRNLGLLSEGIPISPPPDTGDGEENLVPVVDSVSIDTAAHPSDDAHFDVTWGASDENGNLDSLYFELRNLTTGEARGGGNFPAEQWGDGESASNNPGEPFRFVSQNEDGSGDTYQIKIIAIDSSGATDSDSAQVDEENVVTGSEPSFIYSRDCYTNVDNATVHSPKSHVLPNGEQIVEGDTIATVSPRGNCVGHITASDSGKFTLAVAAKNDTTLSIPDTSGMKVGEDFSFEIYDKSEDLAYSVWPIFEPCKNLDVPVCKDSSGYEDDVFFQIDSLQVQKP